MKIQLEREHIGNAFLPKKGVFPISQVNQEFPTAPFLFVWDMDGIRHQVHRNSVSLFNQQKV